MFEIKFEKNLYKEGFWNGTAKLNDEVYPLVISKIDAKYGVALNSDLLPEDPIDAQALRAEYTAQRTKIITEVVEYIRSNAQLFE